ncbi:MAG: PPOX class F420-dependent oxidoreductase, partial [Chloroflexi bacterium]
EAGYLRIFTLHGTQKEKNMLKRPAATILLTDADDPFRYLEVRGKVEEMTEQGAEELADRLTQKYLNAPHYFGHVAPAEQKGAIVLIACKIKPTRVVTVG